MKTMLAGHACCDDSQLEETEFALAISPCPQLDAWRDADGGAQTIHQRSGIERRRRARRSGPADFSARDFDESKFTNSLAIGWVIALAIAVWAGIYVSGA